MHRLKIYIPIFIVLITFISYFPLKDNHFLNVYDDADYITKNIHINNRSFRDVFSWAFTSFYAANWHPVTWISHYIDIKLFGLNPSAHHLMNLVIHILNAVLLYLLCNSIIHSMAKSFFIAILFAIHPIHIESVAFAAERKDLLSTLFIILTTFYFLSYKKRTSIIRYILSILTYSLSLLSKPMFVTFPIIILFVGIINYRKINFKLLLLESVPFFILAGITGFFTMAAQGSYKALSSLQNISIPIRFGNALIAYFKYILMLFPPYNYSIIYPHTMSVSIFELLSATFSFCLIALYCKKQYSSNNIKPLLLFGLYFILLLPVIGIIQVGPQSLANRYTYIAIVPMMIILSDIIFWLKPTFVRTIIFAVFFLFLGFATQKELRHWKNDVTLFNRAITTTKKNSYAHFFLGNAYKKNGNYSKAEEAYYESITILPTDYCWNNLGTMYLKWGNYPLSEQAFLNAHYINPTSPQYLYNIAIAFYQQSDMSSAYYFFQCSLDADSLFTSAWNYLGIINNIWGNHDNALDCFLKSILLKPNSLLTLENIAYTYYFDLQNHDSANYYFNEILRIDNTNKNAHYFLCLLEKNIVLKKEDYIKTIADN